jgi:hypothetical protein
MQGNLSWSCLKSIVTSDSDFQYVVEISALKLESGHIRGPSRGLILAKASIKLSVNPILQCLEKFCQKSKLSTPILKGEQFHPLC